MSCDTLDGPGACGLHERLILVVLVAGLVTGEVSAVMCCWVYPCYKQFSVHIPSTWQASFYTHGETIRDKEC